MTLAEAIEGLYGAFAPYRRRDAIDACPHCVGREEQDTLARVSLRILSCGQLSRYAFKAIATWGAPEDYKHFLPRILELAITREGRVWPGLDLRLIGRKIQLAGCKSWPRQELMAIRDFFNALWQYVLAHDPEESRWRVDEVLSFIAGVVEDISPFLEAWEMDRSLSSMLQLADFIDSNWADVAHRGQLQGPWREVVGRERMKRWLMDPARRRSLEEAFEHYVDDPPSNRLAAAVDAWQWMTSSVR